MPTDQECFEKLLPELNAIPASEVKPPDTSIEKAVRDGERMAAAAVQDLERFVAVGLAVEIAVQLEEALAALRVAETRYQAACLERQQALATWKGRAPAGLKLRRELLTAQTYAFRKFSSPLSKVTSLGRDETPAEVILDLAELSALGRQHKDLLGRINFDLSLLDLSALQAEELDRIYTRVCASGDSSDARLLRDRAFCRVRRIMAEISDAAQYVLRHDPVRLSVYYTSLRPQNQENPAPETAMTTPAQ
jgi:hypothetical protein